MTARSRHTENSAFIRRTGPRVLAGLLRKGNGGARGGGKGGGLKKAFLSLSHRCPARRERRSGRDRDGRGLERSDETKEEGRPMLGDKSRLTSRERGL